MRVGTFYFFQAAPGLTHAEVVHRELEQMQDSLRRFQVPERIEDAHPSLRPGFRAAAERFRKVAWEGLVAETLAFGSPDTAARHIQAMRDMGIGHVPCWMNFGGLPQDRIRRSMELFAREVMPHFRD